MKGKFKIAKWNFAGFNEIRKSEGVTNMCQEIAAQRYNAVSGTEGYVMEPRQYPDRNGYAIVAKDYPAISDNLKNNTLVKLIGG